MTMTLGYSHRSLSDLPTKAILETMSALGKLGFAPFIRVVVHRSRWNGKAMKERWPGADDRILHADDRGSTRWLDKDEASPIFADIDAAGKYVAIPNDLAGSFYHLCSLGIPWPMGGGWKGRFPDRRLELPGTPFHGETFSTVQYMMLASREGFSADDYDRDTESMNEIGRQLEAFFRCATRHKLLTDFF